VPVTTREVEQTFPDDTSIELSRGVPLDPLGSTGLFRAHLGGVSTVLRLDAGDVGTRYLPSPPLPHPDTTRVLSSDALAADVPILGETGRLEGEREGSLDVYEATSRGNSELFVEVRPRCARAVVRVPAHVVTEVSGRISGREAEEPSTPPLVRAGATVYWSDGREAGTVASRADPGEEVERHGDRRCFRRAVRPVPPEASSDPSAAVVLCFDRRDVIDPDVGPAELLDAP